MANTTRKTPRAKRNVALTAPASHYQLQKGAILCWMRPGKGRGAIPGFGRIPRGKGTGGTLVT